MAKVGELVDAHCNNQKEDFLISNVNDCFDWHLSLKMPRQKSINVTLEVSSDYFRLKLSIEERRTPRYDFGCF